MAAITWAQVVVFAAELVDVDEEAQNIILAYVHETVNVSKFGGEDSAKTKLVRIYKAAHFGVGALPSEDGSAVAGPVVSESTGGVARSYALVGSAASQVFGSTAYGQKYSELVRTSLARVGRVPRRSCT